ALTIRRLDTTWSLFELPVLVALTHPSSAGEDPQTNGKIRVLNSEQNEVTPESQRACIREHVPLLLSKNAVQVVLWNQLSYAAPHHYPHSGVFDVEDKPKP